jgi:hypothetical protein
MSKETSQTKVIKATNKLQLKVGSGPIDEKKVIESQKVIEDNNVDFGPLGLEILGKLETALKLAQDSSTSMKVAKTLLTTPVMELKANATIFKYALIGNLANIMLGFLENISELDKDAVEIVKAHHNTLHMIVVRKMSGDGGEGGKLLMKELQQACDRYYKKRFGS